MNGKTNENVIVKEYDFNNPHIQDMDSIIDECIRDCHNKYFHTFDHMCEYDIELRNITHNEIINKPIFDKSMGLYELNEK